MTVGTQWNERKPFSRRTRGQGVVEYAGALIIAAVLVSFAIFVVPPNVAAMLSTIETSALTFFMKYLPT